MVVQLGNSTNFGHAKGNEIEISDVEEGQIVMWEVGVDGVSGESQPLVFEFSDVVNIPQLVDSVVHYKLNVLRVLQRVELDSFETMVVDNEAGEVGFQNVQVVFDINIVPVLES